MNKFTQKHEWKKSGNGDKFDMFINWMHNPIYSYVDAIFDYEHLCKKYLAVRKQKSSHPVSKIP